MSENRQDNISPSDDILKDSDLGAMVASTLHKLEYISDHHVKERRKHFRITNLIVVIISTCLLLIALVNVIFLFEFYQSTMRIIRSVHDVDDTVLNIKQHMETIKQSMGNFDLHMVNMDNINTNMSSIAYILPQINYTMGDIGTDMQNMNNSMQGVNQSMQYVDFHIKGINNKVIYMGGNVYKMAEPVGMFNSILP